MVETVTLGIPLGKTIFHVVESRIDEDACVIPCSRFDSNGFMNQTALRKVFIGDGNGYKDQVMKTNGRRKPNTHCVYSSKQQVARPNSMQRILRVDYSAQRWSSAVGCRRE